METFPTGYQPEYAATQPIKPKVLRVSFGDGYEQRIPDGLNNIKRSWSLTYQKKTSDIDTIEAFLKVTKGAAAFTWTPPRGDVGNWIVSAEGWTRDVANYGYEKITVTFEEVFE